MKDNVQRKSKRRVLFLEERLGGKGTPDRGSDVAAARDGHGGDEMLHAWTMPLEESQNCRSDQRSGDKWRRGHQVRQNLSCKTNYCTNIIKEAKPKEFKRRKAAIKPSQLHSM